MYQIGEFSYLCETTIKTLRYYDKINLLKPVKINTLTGYRYYSEKQIDTLKKIKELQVSGFSLAEIKDLLQNENKEKLNEQIKKIEDESSKKIMILQKMKNNMTKQKVEFIANPNFTIVGISTTIKSRDSIERVLKTIDKKIKQEQFSKYPFIVENYEKGFSQENTRCFIGRILPDYILSNPNFLHHYNKKGIRIINSQKIKNVLHTTVETTILDSYKKIIEYANTNNFQIRGPFQEVYNNDKIDIYIEAYDLNQENQDELVHRKQLSKVITDTHAKEFIGKWQLMGEIIEPAYLFNPKKTHTKTGSKYEYIELYKDGSTNFENISWRDHYLVMQEDNIIFYSYLYKPYKKGFSTYMNILINSKESNSRPYKYYYKKIK